MALNSIEKEWQNFSKMVFSGCPNVSEQQRSEMKKAFFAGAFSLVQAVCELGEPHIPEAEGIRFMEARANEGRAFYKKLIKEYAEKN